MNSLIDYIKSDLERIAEPTLKNFLKEYFSPTSICFRYVVNLRVVQAAKKANTLVKYIVGGPAYLRLIQRENKYGIHTNTNILIGKGLHIVHAGGVFLNVTSIGDNFTVLQNVTFGRRFAGDQIPTIGNNVTVCTNAVVCGGIMLHDGCTVGANSYVNQDVPANSLVAGSPAKVIKKGAEC